MEALKGSSFGRRTIGACAITTCRELILRIAAARAFALSAGAPVPPPFAAPSPPIHTYPMSRENETGERGASRGADVVLRETTTYMDGHSGWRSPRQPPHVLPERDSALGSEHSAQGTSASSSRYVTAALRRGTRSVAAIRCSRLPDKERQPATGWNACRRCATPEPGP